MKKMTAFLLAALLCLTLAACAGVGFCGTADRLPAAGRIWSEDIPTLWGALEDGRYRLGYHVSPTGGTEQTIYGEFTIYTPEGNQGLPLADAFS